MLQIEQQEFEKTYLCGYRFLPMTEEVYQSLNNILKRRKKIKTEIIVDG